MLKLNSRSPAQINIPIGRVQVPSDVPGDVVGRALPERQNSVEASIGPQPLADFPTRIFVEAFATDKGVLVKAAADLTVLVCHHEGDWRMNLALKMLDKGAK